MPVFAHLEGICHVYIHAAADLAMAEKIVVNAKMRRTSICGAAETLLVDKAVVATHLKPIVEALQKAGCEIRGDETTRAMVKGVKAAVSPTTAANISTPSSPPRWSTGWARPSPISSATAPITPTPS